MIEDTHLVSIIIPVHNSQLYIQETISSCLNQSYKNIEILVVNDGSTDGFLSVLQSFNDPRITLLNQQQSGAAAARNNGIRHAKGDYIQFLDADDILSPTKIEIQVKALLTHTECVAVCSTVHFYDGTDYRLQSPSAYENSFLYSTNNTLEFLINLWGGNGGGASMVQTNAWLVPKILIDKNRPWEEFYSPDDDGEYFSRILLSAKGLVFTKDCFNYYRKFKFSNSLSSRNSERALTGYFSSIICKKNTLSPFLDDLRVRKAIGNQLIEVAISSFPRYKHLTFRIEKELKKLDVNYEVPNIGGSLINVVAKLFGWKLAKYAQYHLKKFKLVFRRQDIK